MIGPGATTALRCRWYGRLARRRLAEACAGGHGGGPPNVLGTSILPAGVFR
jgi:hypothetical protein